MRVGEMANDSSVFWEGIYERFDDVLIESDIPFNGQAWLENISGTMKNLKEGDPLRTGAKSLRIVPTHLLPVIALIDDILHESRRVRIYDVGGGVGDNYCYLSYWYPKEARELIEYNIVETKGNCVAGRELELLGDVKWIESTGNWDEILTPSRIIDMIIICGTLQFINPWEKMLASCARSGCKYIYITRSPLQNIRPTFYSKQYIVPGNPGKHQGECIGVTPTAIFNKNEIVNEMKKDNYELALDLFCAYCGMNRYEYRDEITVVYYNMIFRNKT